MATLFRQNFKDFAQKEDPKKSLYDGNLGSPQKMLETLKKWKNQKSPVLEINLILSAR